MYFTDSSEGHLDDLLNRIGEKLQLDKTRRKKTEDSYLAVCKWIKEDTKYFDNYDIDFYPQGSYSIGTTVKPMSKEEFDLDFVLHIYGNYYTENPMNVLKQLERRFGEHDVYKEMYTVKNRCIRLNYAREFHMDILPGFPTEVFIKEDTKLKVPDRTLKDWTDSNPKGYIKWFESQSRIKILMEKAAKIEPLPDDIPYERIEPLKRIVQLIKRYRNIYFAEMSDRAPGSIVLTTLCGHYYQSEENVYLGARSILNRMYNDIIKSSTPIEIRNPANNDEILSEKWIEDEALYKDFKKFIFRLRTDWNNLIELETLEEKANVLKELFGETVSKEVIQEQAEYVSKARANKMLGVTTETGILTGLSGSTLNIKPIGKNTFYGK
jgi:hypothetical protein